MKDFITEYPEDARALLESFTALQRRMESNVGDKRCIDIFMGKEVEGKPTNPQLIEMCMTDCDDKDFSDKWKKDTERVMIRLFDHTSKHAFEITTNDLISFFRDQKNRKGQLGREKVSPATIKRMFCCISSFFQFLANTGHLKVSPYPAFYNQTLKRYLSHNNLKENPRHRISLEQMKTLIQSCHHPRNRAILFLLAKTGIRASELFKIDARDVNWETRSIVIRERKNGKLFTFIFLDDECFRILKKWSEHRKCYPSDDTPAFFVSDKGQRLNYYHLDRIIKIYAIPVGLHKEKSPNKQERFTSHCFRHFFKRTLRQAGMPREVIKLLRGDTLTEAIDDYDEYTPDELRAYYLEFMPKFKV